MIIGLGLPPRTPEFRFVTYCNYFSSWFLSGKGQKIVKNAPHTFPNVQGHSSNCSVCLSKSPKLKRFTSQRVKNEKKQKQKKKNALTQKSETSKCLVFLEMSLK